MIKFFRKIRQKLLNEKKFSRYLIYAIGEIIIVVFGILIALNFNNWNQNQINKKSEIKILSELKNDFKSNYQEIKDIIFNIDKLYKTSDTIFYLMENDIPIENHIELLNTMGGFMGFLGGYGGVFNSANTSYKYLESTGIKIISNDSLRISITEMFEEYFRNIHVREEQYKVFYTNEYEPFVTEYFEFNHGTSGNPIISQVNLSSKTNKRIFKNIIIKKASHEKFRIKSLKETLVKLEELIDDLEIEIEYLEK